MVVLCQSTFQPSPPTSANRVRPPRLLAFSPVPPARPGRTVLCRAPPLCGTSTVQCALPQAHPDPPDPMDATPLHLRPPLRAPPCTEPPSKGECVPGSRVDLHKPSSPPLGLFLSSLFVPARPLWVGGTLRRRSSGQAEPRCKLCPSTRVFKQGP